MRGPVSFLFYFFTLITALGFFLALLNADVNGNFVDGGITTLSVILALCGVFGAFGCFLIAEGEKMEG